MTLIELNTGLGFVPVVGVAGTFPMFPTQQIRITYAVSAPTLTTVQL